MSDQTCRSEMQALSLVDHASKMHCSDHMNIMDQLSSMDELASMVTQIETASSGVTSTKNCESDPFRVLSLGCNSCIQPEQHAPPINLSNCQQDQINKVLQDVCQECDLQHAEVMYPTPDGMVVTDKVTWSASQREREFHAKSQEYVFPPKVGMPGRIMAEKKMEWHNDVSVLPAHIFLRKRIATAAGLKGSIAIPYQIPETETTSSEFVVFIFYSKKVFDGGEDIERIVQSFASTVVLSNQDFSRTGSDDEACETAFDPLKYGDSVKLFAGNMTAKRVMPIGGSRLVLGRVGASSGRVVWKVRVDRCLLAPQLRQWCCRKYKQDIGAGGKSAHGVRIGVAQEEAPLKWYAGFDEHSFGMDWQGNAWSGGKVVAAHTSGSAQVGEGFQEGDVVSVIVDMSALRQRTVQFAVNDVMLPQVYCLSSFNPDRPIFVAVSLLWPGEQATLLSERLCQ